MTTNFYPHSSPHSSPHLFFLRTNLNRIIISHFCSLSPLYVDFATCQKGEGKYVAFVVIQVRRWTGWVLLTEGGKRSKNRNLLLFLSPRSTPLRSFFFFFNSSFLIFPFYEYGGTELVRPIGWSLKGPSDRSGEGGFRLSLYILIIPVLHTAFSLVFFLHFDYIFLLGKWNEFWIWWTSDMIDKYEIIVCESYVHVSDVWERVRETER